MRRLVIVLADGLRPDAVSPSVMPSLDALGRVYTLARRARTVRPSATVAALASLATGVGPDTHRLVEPGLGFLPRLPTIRPVSRVLARAGIPTDIVTAAQVDAGLGLLSGWTDEAVSLLDVPATVLWWFGVPVPGDYEGRPLAEAFARVSGPTPVPA